MRLDELGLESELTCRKQNFPGSERLPFRCMLMCQLRRIGGNTVQAGEHGQAGKATVQDRR